MVNLFGTSDIRGGKRGKAGADGVDGLKDIINWVPEMICNLFRKKINVLTLLINTLPPAKDPDVELSSDKEVKKWFSYNDRERIILTPIDEKVGKLETRTDLPSEGYGLVFDKKQKIMYHIEDCKNVYLSVRGINIILTLTFLVGEKEEEGNDDVAEEFIVSDYRWSKYDKRSDVHRGISTIAKSNKKFDLYLHGAIGDDDGLNKRKIGENLERDVFYTLQVCWRKANTGFYSLYKYTQLLIDRTSFQHNTTPGTMAPVFYLGGFDTSRDWRTVVKSKCFTGVISNLEVIQTENDSISDDLLKLIVDKQSVFNPWSRLTNNEEEEDEPPAAKRMKLTNQ